MERAFQIYAIVNLTVIGISHVARPRVWVDLSVFLRERREAGVFAVAILNLIFGWIIVTFHNVWSVRLRSPKAGVNAQWPTRRPTSRTSA
jgi:hypothetical protein